MDSGGTKTFKRDGVGVTDAVLNDGAASYTPGVSERRSGTSKFYHGERQGTNALETNSSQAVTATRTYDAFGMLVATTGSSSSPFGYVGAQGYQEDGDSGLKLLGHRYYDPSTGRFLTRDHVKDGRNWYGYCDNNPLRSTDPSGLEDYFNSPGLHAGFGFGWIGIDVSINFSPGRPYYKGSIDLGPDVGFSLGPSIEHVDPHDPGGARGRFSAKMFGGIGPIEWTPGSGPIGNDPPDVSVTFPQCRMKAGMKFEWQLDGEYPHDVPHDDGHHDINVDHGGGGRNGLPCY